MTSKGRISSAAGHFLGGICYVKGASVKSEAHEKQPVLFRFQLNATDPLADHVVPGLTVTMLFSEKAWT